jgi:hypothetical protein
MVGHSEVILWVDHLITGPGNSWKVGFSETGFCRAKWW